MDTRKCHKCGETKPLADFPRNASQPLGHAYACKRCTWQASREWKARNKDKVLAQVARWNAKNPGKRLQIAKDWYHRNKERVAENQRRHKREFPDYKHDIYLKSLYGAPHGTYARLLAEQGEKCAICGATEPGRKLKRFHLDHCHDTGKIRGLLCGNCNTGIAHLQHSKEVFLSAMRYLGF